MTVGDQRRVRPNQPRASTITVTCCMDDRAHEVTDVELASARPDGYFRAICGRDVAAAPMVMPDGQPCPSCTAIREQQTTATGYPRLRLLR